MIQRLKFYVVCMLCGMFFLHLACTNVRNEAGTPGHYTDPREPHVQTLGVDSQDIISAAESAVPDMLASAAVMNFVAKPRIAVDGEEFRNLSMDPVARQAFTGRLRAELQRASNGRLVIVNPERGRLAGAQGGNADGAFGYDLCLAGEITSTIQPPDAHGRTSSSYQIIFELYVPDTSEIVWSSKPYDIKKGATLPTMYR